MNDRPSDSSAPKRCFGPLGAVVALVLGLVLGMPPIAHAACHIETIELPVRMVGTRAVATVGINGTPVPLAVDSGAFFSMLTEAAAAQLKLPLSRSAGLRVEGLTGSVQTYTTRVDKLQLVRGDIPRVEFVVGGNEPGAGTMGLLGRNLLSFTDTEYDLAHGVIRFAFPNDDCETANMAYWAGSAAVSDIELLTDYKYRKTPEIRANVKLNGHELVALFDSGAASVVLTGAARRAGIAEATMASAGSVYGAGRGTTPIFLAPFDKFEIGNETITRSRLRVADLNLPTADMLLGIDFFLSHRIYVSKKQSKMYFTYVGGPVFGLDKAEVPGAPGFDADPAASGVPTATADQYARRGAASASRNDFTSALADLDRACELDPASAAFFAQRGAIQESLKRPSKALEDFDKALALDPAQADARVRRAWLRFALNDRDGATADLDVLDKAVAAQSQMRLSMANLYLRLDQPAPALAQLDQWLPAHPHEARREIALNNRCRLRLRLGLAIDNALDDCDDAVDSDPNNPNYLDTRGWVYLRLGKARKALSDFDRSIEHRPGNAFSLYGRGLAKSRLGDSAEGEADLAAARSAQPDIDARVARAGLTTQAAGAPSAAAAASAPR